jgi:uncharacterized protein (TIGR02266 family)
MGLLHKIERAEGRALDGRDEALKFVRAALDALQKVTTPHPALDTVMEKVATSLSKVHALTRVPAPVAAPVIAAPVIAAPVIAAPVIAAPVIPVVAQAPVAAAPIAAPVVAAPVAQPASLKGQQTIRMQPVAAEPPSGGGGTLPLQNNPVASPSVKTPFNAVPVRAAPASVTEPLAKSAPVSAAAPASKAQPSSAGGPVDVELGIHSSSNFYKGLGGNDVIDHGGLFIATYKIPKIGTAVAVRVLLPGDLEFGAKAVVQWTREASGSSEPGYGVRFTQISQEGRHLVYRYTRNREPMFYDDL